MKRFNLLLFIVVCLGGLAQAQSRKNISTPAYLDSLVNKNIQKHKTEQTIDGYRIQLFSSPDRTNANNLRTKFKSENPDIPVYLIYQQPYFKVRVGDFRNQVEAHLMYLQLQSSFDQMLIVPDKINLPSL